MRTNTLVGTEEVVAIVLEDVANFPSTVKKNKNFNRGWWVWSAQKHFKRLSTPNSGHSNHIEGGNSDQTEVLCC